jgi:hypothetical protein
MATPAALAASENSFDAPRPKSLLVARKSAFLMPSEANSGVNALASICEVGLMRKT